MSFKTLGDVCTFENGDRGKNYPSKGTFVSEGIPFINAGNLKNSLIDTSSLQFISTERFNLLSNGKVKENDILFCLRGSLGKFAIVKGIKTGAIASSLIIIRAKTDLDLEYLKNYLKSPLCSQEITRFENGAAQPNLSAKDLKQFAIPIPPLAEQKQIAAILDAADSLRQKDQQLVEHYTALSQSLFLEMFGDPVLNPKNWHLTKVENVCTKIYGGGTPTKTIQKYFIGDIPWVTPKDMKKQYISDSLVRINHEAIQNSSAKLIPENSVLMVIRSGVLKHTLPLAISTREITINQDMKAFIPDQEQTNSAYLLYFFKSVESFLLGKVRAVTADNLEFNQIKKLSFPAPPLKLQNQFAEHIAIIERQKQQAQANLEKSEALFNSLLQRAFTGELTADKAA